MNSIKERLGIDLPDLDLKSTESERKYCFRKCFLVLREQQQDASVLLEQLNEAYRRTRGGQVAEGNGLKWNELHPSLGEELVKPDITSFFQQFNFSLQRLLIENPGDHEFEELVQSYVDFNKLLQAFCTVEDRAFRVFGCEVASLRELSLRMVLKIKDCQAFEPTTPQTKQLALILLGHWQYFSNVWEHFDFQEIGSVSSVALDLLSDAASIMTEKYRDLKDRTITEFVTDVATKSSCQRDDADTWLPDIIKAANRTIGQASSELDIQSDLSKVFNVAEQAIADKSQPFLDSLQREILSRHNDPEHAAVVLIEKMDLLVDGITNFNKPFEAILNNPDIMQILNRHCNSKLDCAIGLHNTRPWQATFLRLREMAFMKLQYQLNSLDPENSIVLYQLNSLDPENSIVLCNKALQMSIFNKHRSNFAITGAFWNTHHMNKIHELIHGYEKAPGTDIELT